jgi:hypothetical protein
MYDFDSIGERLIEACVAHSQLFQSDNHYLEATDRVYLAQYRYSAA